MITVCYNYYDNKELFEEVKEYWLSTGYNKLLFVDDGSQNEPLSKEDMPEGWRLIRINEDLPFAYNLARNTAMRNSPSDINLMMDLDYLPNRELVRDMNKMRFKKGGLTLIPRLTWDKKYKQHTSQFFIWKKDFWKVGGYDESVTGYGNDSRFRNKFSKRWMLEEPYEIYAIRRKASPQWEWTNLKTDSNYRDVPNPGYTTTRLA